MSFHVLPFGRDANTKSTSGVTPLPSRPAAPGADKAGTDAFAKIYDASVLETARAARAARQAQDPRDARIPAHVMDEVHAAARLYEELRARGQQVQFDTHTLSGRVVADLVDDDGNVVRPISLRDIVESNDPDPGPAAA